MRSPKPLLTWGEETLIEHVIRLFLGVGIAEVKVVLGHQAERILPFIERFGADPVLNDRYDKGMFSSVQAGVRRLDRDCRGFFLHPVDMPLISPETLRTLCEVFFKEGDRDVCRPCFRGRRGHPPLISSALIPAILSFDGQGGLRALLARHPERSVDIDVADPGILENMNTHADYGEALKKVGF